MGRNVLVHCSMGMQRSPAVVAAYLIKYNKLNVEEAMDYVKRKRPEAFFYKSTFERALLQWEIEAGSISESYNRITHRRSAI
jgi:protein-tyrosine phosphatase